MTKISSLVIFHISKTRTRTRIRIRIRIRARTIICKKCTRKNKIEKTKKSDAENQENQGLKILTSYQMLSRLPITLAQLKAGNN